MHALRVQIPQVVAELDSDADKRISREEFISHAAGMKLSKVAAGKMFDSFLAFEDENNDGFLDKQELVLLVELFAIFHEHEDEAISRDSFIKFAKEQNMSEEAARKTFEALSAHLETDGDGNLLCWLADSTI